MPDNPELDSRLAGHVDLSVFQSGSGQLFASGHLKRFFQSQDVRFPPVQFGKEYPQDVPLNGCVIGEQLLANPRTLHPEILELYQGERLIPVRQGYSRCCTLVVRPDAAVTADSGIAKALRRRGKNVLQIRQGSIELPGFAYGFIGGCGFFADSSTLLLTGSLNTHPDGDRIRSFLADYGIRGYALRDGLMIDIGGAVRVNELTPAIQR